MSSDLPARPDPTLAVPPPAAPVPPLRVEDPELGLAGAAGDGAALLEGERGSVRVRERGGVEAVWLDGFQVAAELSVDAGVAVNRVASPALLRRERVAGGASLEETLLLPPRLPLLALQLHTPSGAPAVAGRVTLPPWAGPLRWSVEGDRLAAVARDAPDLRVVLALSPEGGELEVEPDAAGGLAVRFRLPAAAHPTLLLAAGPAGGTTPLAPAAHLGGHARMATAASAGGLALRSGLREVDEAVAWARSRLAAAARRPSPAGAADPSGIFWSGMGALAAGDEEAAAGYLRALEAAVEEGREVESDRPGPAEGTASPPAGHPLLPSPPLPVLLAARHALTVGDAGPALRQAARVEAGAAERPARPDEALLWSLALGSLGDALRWSAGEEVARRLRAEGERLGRIARSSPAAAGRAGAGGGGVRLPMAGEGAGPASAGGAARVLKALLSPEAEMGGELPAQGELAPWVAFHQGRSSAAWGAWREALARGIDGPGPGPGSWDAWRPWPEAPQAALLVATLVHGLLGWYPDAPVGRAVLAPRLPGHLTAFGVEGLRVGDATLALRYEREGALRRFRLTPTAGRAPVTLVLEPWVPGPDPVETRLDGKAVELDPRAAPGGQRVVPLQIPLDGPRTLEIEGGPGSG